MRGGGRIGACETGFAQWAGVNGSLAETILLQGTLGVCVCGLSEQFLTGLVAGRGYVVGGDVCC